MAEETEAPDRTSHEGIIVETSLELLRKAIARAIFEYKEMCYSPADGEIDVPGVIDIGETIIFQEDMDLHPAEIVAVKIGEAEPPNSVWYIISTSEMPPSGYPTSKDAMKAAAAEEKKLEILKAFFSKEAEAHGWSDLKEWQPDKRYDAGKIRAIIDDATKKWIH
ncbi:MAG: hypothetical protein ACFFAY_04410 [Promethearchaeota archaeon]